MIGETQLANIPITPGVYIYKDAQDNVLYVGKAKVLRTRVRSYFRPLAALDPAKQQMVALVDTIDTISCDTEHEALILEANLIRKHQPPYNVVLTDDKYYLFIKITKEELPRVYPVRRISQDGARYFGPYSSASSVRRTLKLLRRLFPHYGESREDKTWIFPHPLFAAAKSVRRSPVSVSQEKKQELGEGGLQTLDPATYQENIHNITRFLEGKRDAIMATLRQGMKAASQQKAYEQAALFRDQLSAIERMEGSQKVYLPRNESFDVVSIVTRESKSAANVFSVRAGKLLQKNTFLLRHRSVALPADVLRQFLLQYYRVAQDIPALILTPWTLPDENAIATWINKNTPPTLVVPQRGKKRQLISMGDLNAQQLLMNEEAEFASETRLRQATTQLATALGLTDKPLHRIETYDISNIQGTLATGSMVVFKDGLPEKSQYKKFRIQLGETPNDFAMLQEVLRRRFSNRHPDWPMPDLIIIDGGKGQLSAAMQVLTELHVTVPVMALAKREEEVFVPGRSAAIRLPFDSDVIYLLQRMRDEAHRFTITYHRLLRSKRQRRSLLDEVPGIGPRLKQKLLNRFGSLKGIRAAGDTELADLIGEAKTKQLREYL